MTAEEVTAVRKLLGLSQLQLARALGLKSRAAVSRWEAGTHVMKEAQVKLLRYLVDEQAEKLKAARPR